MPRRARVVFPDRPHHVTQRGNNRRQVFFSNQDREVYLTLLKEYAAEYSAQVLGYCLMPNHVHLIVIPRAANALAKALGRTHNDYARWLHIRRRESGHLWQNRFFSCPMDQAYTWAALAYIERNPIRAALASTADGWVWSSARRHLGLEDGPGWLNVEAWSQVWTTKAWRTAIEHGIGEAEVQSRLHEGTRRGTPIGSAEFIGQCERELGIVIRSRKPGPKPAGR